jgi:hypothetical protein
VTGGSRGASEIPSVDWSSSRWRGAHADSKEHAVDCEPVYPVSRWLPSGS